ncbi:MAG: carbohydrate ABC transporter permease [Phycisphaerales bacterium]|nr:carbohydrate ABC transporter permease [Phycisphaerales bacterium]
MARRARRLSWLRLLVGAVLLLPLVWAAWASLQPVDRIFAPVGAHYADSRDGLRFENYEKAMTRLPFLRFMLNSCVITLASTIGSVLSCSLAGFAFARLRWKFRRVAFVLALLTMAVPLNLILLPQFLIFERLGWVNTYKPLIVPHWLAASGFFVFLFRQAFLGTPKSLEDAARIEGATNWRLYWDVMLPHARPVVAVVAALAAVGSWNAFFAPMIYLSDFETYPASVGLRMFHVMEGTWPNLMMAAAIVSMGPPLLVLIVAQRWLLRRIDG